MIPPAENLSSLMTNLTTFIMLHGASLPDHTREALLASAGHPSPVDRLVNSAEVLYAAKNELTKEGREIGAQLAMFAAANGFHGMGERGQQMAYAYNRIGGFTPPAGAEWPAAEDDPEPSALYLPPAEDDPAPAPGEDPAAEEPALQE